MSLLSRLRVTEAQKIQDAASAQADDEASQNLDPRTKMMKDIQAMFDGYVSCSVDGSGALADDRQDNLSLKLKHEFCTWGGMLYATSMDSLQSACQTLTQRVEDMAMAEKRIADEVASAHENFAYPLGASLVQQERSGVPTGKATSLDDAAASFQHQFKNIAGELDALWGDFNRSWDELTASAQALASGSLDGSDECRNMSEDFEKFIQEQLETFRQTCEEDFEKMEILEQDFKEQLQTQVSNYLKCLVADL